MGAALAVGFALDAELADRVADVRVGFGDASEWRLYPVGCQGLRQLLGLSRRVVLVDLRVVRHGSLPVSHRGVREQFPGELLWPSAFGVVGAVPVSNRHRRWSDAVQHAQRADARHDLFGVRRCNIASFPDHDPDGTAHGHHGLQAAFHLFLSGRGSVLGSHAERRIVGGKRVGFTGDRRGGCQDTEGTKPLLLQFAATRHCAVASFLRCSYAVSVCLFSSSVSCRKPTLAP